MSRCYKFPPPGYEKKTRTEDIDLLKKEKSREKKHKKEKRDKEKKESKEKREKDRSDEKQKEKRERHKEKRKDKDKIRDKDKNNHVMSDEKKPLGHAETEKGEKNHERSKEREKERSTALSEKVMGKTAVSNGVVLGKNNHLVYENKNLKQLHELGNKNETEGGKRGNSFAEKYPSTDTKKDMGKSAVSNGVVLGKNSHLVSENKNLKKVHELGNKNESEENKRGNLFSEKYPSTETKKDVGTPRIGVGINATPVAMSERSKERKVNDGGNRVVQKVAGLTQNRVEGAARELREVEKKAGHKIEVKEKIRGVEGDGKKREKRKGEDRDKSTEKNKAKVKKIKVERPKDIVEQSTVQDSDKVHADLLTGKDGNKKESVVTQSARSSKLVKEDSKPAAATTPEVVKKRKEFSPHGVLNEGDVVPNKVPRITFSSLPMTENGRRPLNNSTTVFAPVKQQALSNAKQDEADIGPNKMARITVTENGRSSTKASQDSTIPNSVKQQAKDHKINGTNNSLQPSSKAPQSAAPVKKKLLLPHPDTKYLTQVLSVPQMEDWSGFDEQDWLFSSSSGLNKPKKDISRVDDTIPQVWTEALRIDSVDLYALPYVIPR